MSVVTEENNDCSSGKGLRSNDVVNSSKQLLLSKILTVVIDNCRLEKQVNCYCINTERFDHSNKRKRPDNDQELIKISVNPSSEENDPTIVDYLVTIQKVVECFIKELKIYPLDLSDNSFNDQLIVLFDKESKNLVLDGLSYRTSYAGLSSKQFYGRSNVSVVDHSSVYQSFPLQEQAFQFYDELDVVRKSKSKLYSYESIQSGKRRFLVADFDTFSGEYSKLFGENRHVYEIIREDYPCRGYFDLEYSVAFNSEVDGQALLLSWIRLVIWKFYQEYLICLDLNNFVVLDSSTGEKYSKHVSIVVWGDNDDKQRELLFRNNLEFGRIVRSILWEVTEPISQSDGAIEQLDVNDSKLRLWNGRRALYNYEHLWVKNKDNRYTLFIDTSVYSRNRAFRLFGSCKYGKTKQVGINQDDKLVFGGLPALHPHESVTDLRQIMKHRLIGSFIIPHNLFDDAVENNKNRICTTKYILLPLLGKDVQVDDDTVTFPTTKVKRHQYNFLLHINDCNFLERNLSTSVVGGLSTEQRCFQDCEFQAGRGKEGTPYTKLDQFVSANICKGGVVGYINGWSMYSSGNSTGFPRLKIRYQVARNRWCENIQRAHKSNGIMMEVDLMSREMVQLCWDPDCRGFKSQEILIPCDVLPSQQDIEDQLLDLNLKKALGTDPDCWG